ncbi:unnamed protein product [Lymnaea stagnalis]|uniref:Uncharacterized protein n=1 Tax=Lymnaea stagnalis TaxID=6523 RepID=A0AAV2H783_LYMST
MIHHQTKSAWRHFKFIFPYTSELSTCAEELYLILLFLATSMRNGFFTTLLITAVYIFTSLKRLSQCNNRSTNRHNFKHRGGGCSSNELDIHHDLFLCAKNPGHKNFFPISKFRRTDLPEGFRFTDIVKFIDLVSNLVVKITLDDVSTGRPRGSIFDLNHPNEHACSYGSGYLWNAQCCRWHSDVACPCRKCHHPRATDWGELRIVTANHVVFDDAEARGATIELFYNDPHDLSGVTQLIGLKVVDSDMEGDWCEMIAVVHDRHMWNLLVQVIEYCYNSKRAQGAIENLTVQRGKNYLTVIISHPHGSSKQVSVGRCLKRHVSASGTPLLKRIKYDYDTPTCPGSSGAPVLVFGCERHTVSFAPHTRWDQRRKRNASGHAFELEQSDFWLEPPAPRSPFKLRTILRNKFISKSQRVKLLYRKCRIWLVARCYDLVSWLSLDRMFDFKTKKMIGTHALDSSITTPQDSSEPIETPSDVRTYQDSNQWQSARARACAKQHHEKFIPFNAFTLNNLPPEYQDEDIVKAVRYLGILTGKLTVLSMNRSGMAVQGTCNLRYFDPRFVLEKPECPCPKCKSSGRPPKKWATFIASSAAHVMKNFKDGGLYVCELLYDDEEHPENIRKLYGQSILKIDLDNGSCDFQLVTHDMELCALINKTLKDF